MQLHECNSITFFDGLEFATIVVDDEKWKEGCDISLYRYDDWILDGYIVSVHSIPGYQILNACCTSVSSSGRNQVSRESRAIHILREAAKQINKLGLTANVSEISEKRVVDLILKVDL